MAEDFNNVKKKKAGAMINRYGFLVILLSFVFIAIFVAIVQIMFKEGDMWRALGKRETVKTDRVILPNRGNIYAVDGRLLATSEPLYGIYVDFMSEGIRKDTLMKYVDDLSIALARKYPDRSASQYKNIFLDGWALSRKELAQIERAKESGSKKRVRTRSRYIRIIRRDINYVELKELRTFPFFKQRSNRSGMIAEEKTMREKPFGRLAGRTIGSIYKDINMGGASGIEMKYDSILRGEPGVKSRQKVQGRWIDIVEMPAKDGLDVQTTIDIDIQDIVEKALYSKLSETDAESGCAIIMDVQTGEVKAISNLDRVATGVYAEGNPNAFSYMSEPGSTFKALSLMIALEDGVVTPVDSFHVGTGLFQYRGKWVRDHYWRRGKDYGNLSVAQGMHLSSNIVISKMILKGYESNPERYVQRLYDIGITKKIDWDVPLKGKEGTSIIRHPKDKSNPWSKTTLPWMSFGYETQVPPIYMLMFYNGIANNGKMIKPFITKSFMRDGKVVEEFKTEVINPAICSEKTLKEVQEILRGVVTLGTGKLVESKSVEIAGKTGTAQIASGGAYNSGYYVSFCGYFPANNPRYTCFVGIRRPKGIPSGGGMPGAVFKTIAEETFARNVYLSPRACKSDSLLSKVPNVKNGSFQKLTKVLTELGIVYHDGGIAADWVNVSSDSNLLSVRKNTIIENTVPNVIGMGARDALYLLEKSGMRVGLSGFGKVTKQSIEAGSHFTKGTHINIHLE